MLMFSALITLLKTMSVFYRQLSFFTVVGLLIPSVLGSLGDNLPEFKQCVKYCDILACNNINGYPDMTSESYKNLLKDQELLDLYDLRPVTFFESLLGWDCFSDCDYQCTRLITENRASAGEEIYQFHGKWPFLRVFGIQELFSTLFSIGNWIPNYWGFKLLFRHYNAERRKGNKEAATLFLTYTMIPVVSMFAWFFSTVFHLKDTWDRERLDYFFAGMTVLTGFHAVGIRYFKLYTVQNTFKRQIFTSICILLYLAHVIRLLLDWSYTYNMTANVVIGLLQNILWVHLDVSQFRKVYNKNISFLDNIRNKEYRWTLTPVALVASVLFGMSFELFDFPPIFDLLDAHALWHFVTIWPIIFWYPYMVKDVEGLMNMKFD